MNSIYKPLAAAALLLLGTACGDEDTPSSTDGGWGEVAF